MIKERHNIRRRWYAAYTRHLSPGPESHPEIQEGHAARLGGRPDLAHINQDQ